MQHESTTNPQRSSSSPERTTIRRSLSSSSPIDLSSPLSIGHLLPSLRRSLTRPQWQNFVVLLVAVTSARCLVQRRLTLDFLCSISSGSCYRRLARVLSWPSSVWTPLQRAWVRVALRIFAPGRGAVEILVDWTWQRARCRSLWVMLPVGGAPSRWRSGCAGRGRAVGADREHSRTPR